MTATPMLDDFILRAAAAGIGLSLATGPLGSVVLWRRMAYFGDATAHAAILGVALALAFNLPIVLGTLAVAVIMAVTVATLAARGWAVDTALGVLSHGALAFGLLAISYVKGVHASLESFLFGDILAVDAKDLLFIWGGACVVLALLAWRWQRLLTATVNAEVAQAAGINPDRERLILTLALAIVVAVSLKVVGALLIAAMLVIPAAAARSLSRSPEQMAGLAALTGAIACLAGLGLSLLQDTPAGPSIVAMAAAIFAILAGFGRAVQRGNR